MIKCLSLPVRIWTVEYFFKHGQMIFERFGERLERLERLEREYFAPGSLRYPIGRWIFNSFGPIRATGQEKPILFDWYLITVHEYSNRKQECEQKFVLFEQTATHVWVQIEREMVVNVLYSLFYRVF